METAHYFDQHTHAKKRHLTLWSAPFLAPAVSHTCRFSHLPSLFFGQMNKRQCEVIENNQTTTKSKAK
jgi:hypothetical protein